MSQVVRHPANKHVYTIFISNNGTLIHFWERKNFEKHQKVSKYYENDCLQNWVFLFITLLTAPIVKKVMFRLEFTFSL